MAVNSGDFSENRARRDVETHVYSPCGARAMNPGKLGMITAILFVLCILNMAVFLVITERIGGIASLGKFEDDRYYVGNHGKYTEVTHTMYAYSVWQERILHGNLYVLCVFGFSFWIREKIRERKRAKETMERNKHA